MNSDIDHELFENQVEEFYNHLELDGNYRIIFSGRFGIGKTTFLKHFFNIPENIEKYRAIHLFPVNYSVGENADIFEYIKYDIVAHLLSEASKNNITLDETTIPRRLAYPMLLSKKPIDVIAPLLHFLGPLGKVYEGYKKLFDELEDERKEAETDEKKALEEYIKEAQENAGSPYEQDFYSQLIIELLEQWKETEVIETDEEKQADKEVALEARKEGHTVEEVEKREDEEKDQADVETILIIDDLDRVDPQHIFRLLNVFAAHFDAESDHSHNKFGFDKVIFVCDEANIRSIFRHHYGIKTDFNGYLDKFFSKEIYLFRIREDVLKRLSGWVDDFYDKRVNHLPPASGDSSVISINYFTSFILETLVKSDAINMRSLAELWTGSKFTIKDIDIKFGDEVRIGYRNSIVFSAIEIIKWLIGNIDDLILAIDKCISYNNRFAIRQNSNVDRVLLVHLPHKKSGSTSGNENYTYTNREYNLSATFLYKERDITIGTRILRTVRFAEGIEYSGDDSLHRSVYSFVLLKDLVQRLYN